MRRWRLLGIEDHRWCPGVIHDAATDYLRFTLETAKPYAAVIPRLRRALEQAGKREVVGTSARGAAGRGSTSPPRWRRTAIRSR